MSGHVSTERMNDALDGLLDAAEERRIEAHLGECEACRDTYARLSEVVAELRALPRSAEAPAELWAGIEARIHGAPPEARDGGATVVAFPGTSVRSRRRWSLSAAQLAAAAGLVALVSASLTWTVLSGPAPAGPTVPEAAVSVSAVGAGSGPAARAVSAGESYESAVSELEAILVAGRGLLAPETLLTIDTSLKQIDDAMAEVRDALAEDPASPILARMMAQHRTAKLRVLTQAANAVQASL